MADENNTNAVWKNDTSTSDNTTLETTELNITDIFDGLISFAEYQSTRQVLYTIFIPMLCFFGSLGSSIGVGALVRALRKEASMYNIYLFSLFIFDTLTLLYGFWTGIPAIVSTFDQKLGLYLDLKRIKYHTFFHSWLFNNSAFIVIIISIQRLLAFTKPHTVKDACLTKYPSKLAVATFMFNAVFCSPTLLIYDSKLLVDSASYSTVRIPYRPHSIIPAKGSELYGLANSFVYQFLEITLALFVNAGIIVMIKKRAKERESSGVQSLSAIERRQQKLTYTTMSILGLFILLKIPRIIGAVIGLFTDESGAGYYVKQYYYFILWFDIYFILSYLNCSLDVPIYVLSNSRVRKELFQRFCCKKRTNTVGRSRPYRATGDN